MPKITWTFDLDQSDDRLAYAVHHQAASTLSVLEQMNRWLRERGLAFVRSSGADVPNPYAEARDNLLDLMRDNEVKFSVDLKGPSL